MILSCENLNRKQVSKSDQWMMKKYAKKSAAVTNHQPHSRLTTRPDESDAGSAIRETPTAVIDQLFAGEPS